MLPPEIDVVLDAKDLEDAARSHTVRIIVTRADGKRAMFWAGVRIERGRPIGEMTARANQALSRSRGRVAAGWQAPALLDKPVTYTYTLDDAELATVLAALRYYQQNGQGEPFNRSDAIHDIATNEGKVMSSLDEHGIDVLCNKLNLAGSNLIVLDVRDEEDDDAAD